jgi:preprotein translocase subunit YajC
MNAETGIVVVLLIVLVFFMFRSRRKRQRDQAELQTKMVPGVEVMLTFGLYGTLVSVDEVEIAPGTVVKVHRQTLGRVVEPVPAADATDTVVDPAEATPSYSLNEDSAIQTSSPEFGERLDQTTSRDKDGDKS